MPAMAPRCTLSTLTRPLVLGAALVLCASPAQAQRVVTYTDADGVSHTHAQAPTGNEPSTDNKSIVYRYTDAQGVVHFYAERVENRDQLMASSAATLNHQDKDATVTKADPPFVRTMMAHPDARKYDGLLSQASGEFGVDAALLKAVMTAESGFNARAVSTKGAVGLMQVLPATAERYGLQGDRRKSLHQKLTDPKINIRLAARYLRDLMAMFPQRAELAIASYNAGEGAVQKYGNKIPPYPETQGYVRLVSRFYQLYRPGGAINVASAERAATSGEGKSRLTVTLPPHTPNIPLPPGQPEATGTGATSARPQEIAGSSNTLNDQHD